MIIAQVCLRLATINHSKNNIQIWKLRKDRGKTKNKESRTLILSPPPNRRVPRRNISTGEEGWAPWRLVQDGDMEGLQGDLGSLGGHGGHPVALAALPTDICPPPKKMIGENYNVTLGRSGLWWALRRSGLWWVPGRSRHLRALWRHRHWRHGPWRKRHLSRLVRSGHWRALWKHDTWGHSGSADTWGRSGSSDTRGRSGGRCRGVGSRGRCRGAGSGGAL